MEPYCSTDSLLYYNKSDDIEIEEPIINFPASPKKKNEFGGSFRTLNIKGVENEESESNGIDLEESIIDTTEFSKI